MTGLIDSKTRFFLLLLIPILLASLALIFSMNGFYDDHVDGPDYVGQVEYFQGKTPKVVDEYNINRRSFKPLYGAVGATIAPLIGPQASILVLNILFYIGLAYGFFFLLREFGFDPEAAFIGALWLSTGYPLLKYGLALGTDISGWFFAVVSLLVFLVARRKGSPQGTRLIVLASLIGFLGSLSKETGVFGLLFAGLLLSLELVTAWKKGGMQEQVKKTLRDLAALCLPFFSLEALFLVLNSKVGGMTLVQWFSSNTTDYNKEYYKLRYFIGSEFAAFHILWFVALVGLVLVVRNRVQVGILSKQMLALLAVTTLPVLLWPLFIARIYYIQFLVVIPLALLAFISVLERYPKLRSVRWFAASVPVFISGALFVTAHHGSLFLLLAKLF